MCAYLVLLKLSAGWILITLHNYLLRSQSNAFSTYSNKREIEYGKDYTHRHRYICRSVSVGKALNIFDKNGGLYAKYNFTYGRQYSATLGRFTEQHLIPAAGLEPVPRDTRARTPFISADFLYAHTYQFLQLLSICRDTSGTKPTASEHTITYNAIVECFFKVEENNFCFHNARWYILIAL
jgi:hypothetical protein